MCEFQQLYFNGDGYVVRCIHCGHYQLGYASMMLVFTPMEFVAFSKAVKYKCEKEYQLAENKKSISIPIPSRRVTLLLTRNEAIRLCEILDVADTEAKVLELINMFNS